MSMNRLPGVITGLLLTMAVTGLTLNCQGAGEKSEAAQVQSMIIVFSSGAKIIREKKEMEAQVGAIVSQGDILKTEQGIVDLQTRSGSAIRIREFTTIAISSLIAEKTKLNLKHGTVLAKVQRQSAGEQFIVATPTAIAGVRGTTFRVEFMDEQKPPTVKVMEGKVAMSPRVQSLEKFSKEEIEASPALKKLAKIEKQETILEQETTGTIDPTVDKQVREVNSVLEKADGKKGLARVEKKIEKVAEKIKTQKKPTVIKEKEAVTVQDFHDTSSMVAVNTETFDKITENPGAAPEADVALLKKEYEKKRDEGQEKILKKIEETAQKKKLKTEKQIRQQYNKFELVVLKDGTKIRGAVIATTRNVLMVHTKDGVQRIEKTKVDYQQMLY